LVLVPNDHPTNDWGASEVHDWGVPPPSDSVWDPFGPRFGSGDVTYDLGSWTRDQRETLILAIDENGIPYEFDGRLLTVAQDDERDVDALVAGEELSTQDGPPDEPSALDVAKFGLMTALEALGESL
jgi:hypothetical protein